MNTLKEDLNKPISEIERRWLRLLAIWFVMLPALIVAIPVKVVVNAFFEFCGDICYLMEILIKGGDS